MTSKREPHRRRTALGSASWLALVAATSLGAAASDMVRTQIRLSPASEVTLASRPYRLVVQRYDEEALRDGQLPREGRKPIASAQRAVTREEIERGVNVSLVGFAPEVASGAGHVVAWIEPGEPDLEFDGRTARPGRGSLFGLGRAVDAASTAVEIELDRRVG